MRQDEFNFLVVIGLIISYCIWVYYKNGRVGSAKLSKVERSRRRRGTEDDGIPLGEFVKTIIPRLLGIQKPEASVDPDLLKGSPKRSRKHKVSDALDEEKDEEVDQVMPLKPTTARPQRSGAGVRNRLGPSGPSRPKVRACIQPVAVLGAANEDAVDIEQEDFPKGPSDDAMEIDFDEVEKNDPVDPKHVSTSVTQGKPLLSDSGSDSDDLDVDNGDCSPGDAEDAVSSPKSPVVNDEGHGGSPKSQGDQRHGKIIERTQVIADISKLDQPDAAAAVSKLAQSLISCDVWRIVSKKNKLRVAGCLRAEATGTEALGFTVYRVQQCTAQVLFLGVAESSRRHGVGRDLIRVIRDAAKREPLCLSVVALLEPAVIDTLPFWRANGFKKVSVKVEDMEEDDEDTCFELEIRKLGKQMLKKMGRCGVAVTGDAQALSWPALLAQAKLKNEVPVDVCLPPPKRTEKHVNNKKSTDGLPAPKKSVASKKDAEAKTDRYHETEATQNGHQSAVTASDTSVLAELDEWNADQDIVTFFDSEAHVENVHSTEPCVSAAVIAASVGLGAMVDPADWEHELPGREVTQGSPSTSKSNKAATDSIASKTQPSATVTRQKATEEVGGPWRPTVLSSGDSVESAAPAGPEFFDMATPREPQWDRLTKSPALPAKPITKEAVEALLGPPRQDIAVRPSPSNEVDDSKEREHMASVLTDLLGISNGVADSTSSAKVPTETPTKHAAKVDANATVPSAAPKEVAPDGFQRRPPPPARPVNSWVPTLRHNQS